MRPGGRRHKRGAGQRRRLGALVWGGNKGRGGADRCRARGRERPRGRGGGGAGAAPLPPPPAAGRGPGRAEAVAGRQGVRPLACACRRACRRGGVNTQVGTHGGPAPHWEQQHLNAPLTPDSPPRGEERAEQPHVKLMRITVGLLPLFTTPQHPQRQPGNAVTSHSGLRDAPIQELGLSTSAPSPAPARWCHMPPSTPRIPKATILTPNTFTPLHPSPERDS